MPEADARDADQLRSLVHELTEALTAAGMFLAGYKRSEDAGAQHEAVVKAAEQIARADRIVTQLRSLAA